MDNPAARTQERKEVILHVDYAFMVHLGFTRGEVFGEERIRELVRKAAKAGVSTIYWRVEAWGRVTYRSKVRTVPGEVGQMGHELLALILRQCDPLAVAAVEAHKCGLRLYPYVTLFDECFNGVGSDFVKKHPYTAWRHRGKIEHYNPGLLSYAYPEVREHRLAQVRELMDYDVDGIYFDVARSHAGSNPILVLPLEGEPFTQYGFNDPECEEYKRRYGVDPREGPFDEEKWNRLRGEYLTQFLRSASEIVHALKRRVCVGFYTDAKCYLSPAGRRCRIVMGKFHLDWERWVAEDLIDEIVLIAEHRRAGYHDWETHSRPQFVEARRRGKRVYIWCATEASFDELPPPLSPISGRQNRELFLQTMEIVLGRCLETDADGVFMHEAYYIEEMDYWSTIAKVLRGDNSRTSASQRIA